MRTNVRKKQAEMQDRTIVLDTMVKTRTNDLMKPETDHVLSLAERLCEARNISLARLSTLVYGSGQFFKRVDAGMHVTLRHYNDFMSYFATPGHWPDGQVPADLVNWLAPWAPISGDVAVEDLAA